MPITIQEIIASDTISQLVDKTNFNFDQLLLNGGGPAGPFGPAGPIGPAGGRGPKGTTWYDDPSTTSPTDPNTIIVSTDLRKSDYYLDFAGDVWEYDGTSWNQTNIDLEGPPGPSGASGGFSSYFGQNFINKQNTVLATPVGSGGNGATSTNEGIPTVLIGGAASNTSTSGSGFLLTDAYQIPDILATTLASDVVSLLVHQKNNSADAILLMGGNADPAENYSQGPYTEFSKIRLQADDALNIEVPKPATNPTQNLSTVGFNIIAPRRGMQIFAGGQVNMTSGGGAGYGFVGENGNFNITVDNANTAGSAGSQFQVITKGSASASTRILSGRSVGNTAQSPPTAGGILLDSKYFSIVGTGEAKINRSAGPINLSAGTVISATASNNISLSSPVINVGNSTLTQDIRIGTLATNPSSPGVRIFSEWTGTLPTGGANGIAIAAGGASGMNITSEGVAAAGTGITIKAGKSAGGFGFIKIESNQENIELKAFAGDIEFYTNNAQRFKADVDTGLITLGGGGDTGFASTKALLVIKSAGSSFASPFSGPTVNRVIIGGDPLNGQQFGGTGTSDGKLPFKGGAEIIGPHQKTIGFNQSFSSNESAGALNIRGGVDPDGGKPGNVWISAGQNTNPVSGGGTAPDDGTVRLWATATGIQDTTNASSVPPYNITRGLTLGLNPFREFELGASFPVPNGDNVSGRTSIYGIPSNDSGMTSLAQEQVVAGGTGNTVYAGVNVGDYRRGRQTFKVWGDYIGLNHIVGTLPSGLTPASNEFSGPTVENQTFMSGSQTWSQEILVPPLYNTPGPQEFSFSYRLNWQRVGRVVTGSGIIKLRAGHIFSGGGTNVRANRVLKFPFSGFNAKVTVGPIPLPMQVNNPLTGGAIGNSSDGALISDADLQGSKGYYISGNATPLIEYPNNNTIVIPSINVDTDFNALDIDFNPTFGTVNGGDATTSFAGASNQWSNTASHMYVDMYMDQRNTFLFSEGGLVKTGHGVVPGVIKFTFTYLMQP